MPCTQNFHALEPPPKFSWRGRTAVFDYVTASKRQRRLQIPRRGDSPAISPFANAIPLIGGAATGGGDRIVTASPPGRKRSRARRVSETHAQGGELRDRSSETRLPDPAPHAPTAIMQVMNAGENDGRRLIGHALETARAEMS